MTYVGELVQFGQNFDFKIRTDHRKLFFFDRRVYESVDDMRFFSTATRKLL